MRSLAAVVPALLVLGQAAPAVHAQDMDAGVLLGVAPSSVTTLSPRVGVWGRLPAGPVRLRIELALARTDAAEDDVVVCGFADCWTGRIEATAWQVELPILVELAVPRLSEASLFVGGTWRVAVSCHEMRGGVRQSRCSGAEGYGLVVPVGVSYRSPWDALTVYFGAQLLRTPLIEPIVTDFSATHPIYTSRVSLSASLRLWSS